MTDYPPLSTRVVGQAERNLNAILLRLLEGTGLTEPQWVSLALTANAGQVDQARLVRLVADALIIPADQARERLAELAGAGLIRLQEDDAAPAALTEAGQSTHNRVRAAAAEVTGRLWGDLPPADLAVAGRVLAIVTARARTELASLSHP